MNRKMTDEELEAKRQSFAKAREVPIALHFLDRENKTETVIEGTMNDLFPPVSMAFYLSRICVVCCQHSKYDEVHICEK